MEYEAEYVVPLPILPTGKVAGQSEIHFISEDQFLVLARDGGGGHGQASSESIYRNADVFDISKATNIKNARNDAVGGAIASSKGELNTDVVPATYCPWLSYNNNDELNRFGLHNGGDQDATLLNEKWESFALVPVDDKFSTKGVGKEYYLISFSDNDFITQNGQCLDPNAMFSSIYTTVQATLTLEKTSIPMHLVLIWILRSLCLKSGFRKTLSRCKLAVEPRLGTSRPHSGIYASVLQPMKSPMAWLRLTTMVSHSHFYVLDERVWEFTLKKLDLVDVSGPTVSYSVRSSCCRGLKVPKHTIAWCVALVVALVPWSWCLQLGARLSL